MKKLLKPIPDFMTENEERDFWATHDSTDYVDWNNAIINPKFPNLKPSRKSVTLRLPEWLLSDLKTVANKKDVPYQSLMKVYLAEKVKEEFDQKNR